MAADKVSLKDLVLDSDNVCRHSDRNLEVIESSLRQFGGMRSIVIDGDNKVIAGNGTITAARKSGKIKTVRVIDAAPDELVAVRRADLKGHRSAAAALADNRASDLHAYDEDKLRSVVAEIDQIGDIDLSGIGLSADDIDALVGAVASEPSEGDEPDGDGERRMTVCPECGHEW